MIARAAHLQYHGAESKGRRATDRHMRKTIPLIITRVYCLALFLLALGMFPLQHVHADGGAPDLAYVAGASQGVGIIDVAQQKLANTFAVADDPPMILLSLNGQLLYVAEPAAGRVVALAAKTGQTICSAAFPGHPSLLALNIDGTVLYAAGTNETTIMALDAQTCQIQHTFQNAEPISWIVATISNAQSNQVWVAGTSSVSVLDDQWQVSASIPIAGTPRYLSLPNHVTAYVATSQGTIDAIDISTYQVFDTIHLGGTFGPMDYDAATEEVYVPDIQHKQIVVLASLLNEPPLPPEPEQVIPLHDIPESIAITFDGQLGFVALAGGKIAMLDIPGRSVVATIPVGGHPHFIITGPYPPAAIPTPVPLQERAEPPAMLILASTGVLIIGALVGIFWLNRSQHRKRVKR